MVDGVARGVVPKWFSLLRSTARDVVFVCFLLLLLYIATTGRTPAQRILGSLMALVGLYVGGLGHQERSRELEAFGWALVAAGLLLLIHDLLFSRLI